MTTIRKVVCTAAFGPHAALLDVGGPTLERYGAAHGYDVVLGTHDLGGGRPGSWTKVRMLRGLVEEYDFVVWVDADAVIVDASVDLLDATRRGRPLSLVAHRYNGHTVPNFGVVALHGGRWAARFLDRVWASTEFVHHRWWENAAVIRLLGFSMEPVAPRRPTPTRWRTTFLDHSWNSVPYDAARRPRIAHFPGLPVDERVRRMREALEVSGRES